MKTQFAALLRTSLLLAWPGGSLAMPAQDVVQQYEQSQWQLTSSPFECRLAQSIQGVARAAFVQQPGQPLTLQFSLLPGAPAIERSFVRLSKADWHPQAGRTDISREGVADALGVHFNTNVDDMLAGLADGHWLEFLVNPKQPVYLTFTTIHGAQSRIDFQQCLSQLAPMSWEQARELDILFGTGEKLVRTSHSQQLLRNLVSYIALDDAVTKVLVDGHTDKVGDRASNRVLSQARADEVAARLVEYGLKPAMLEVRAHSDRFPVAEDTPQTRQLNRRVTIRLIKAPQ